MDNKVEIIFWNCRSIYNKLFELKKYIYTTKPSIICLQETWVKDEFQPNFINYKVFYKNRNGRGGGIATLVRNDLIGEEKNLITYGGGGLEIQAISLYITNDKLDILNIYNPNKNISKTEFTHYLSQMHSKAVLVGDFNAHHNMWDTKVGAPCITSRNLIESLLTHPMQLVTRRNMPTYMDSRTGATSTIDLCFATPNLYHVMKVELGEDCGSDHCPIMVEIMRQPTMAKQKTRPRWKFNDNWADFRNKILDGIESDSDLNTEALNNHLIDVITKSGEEVFGKTSGIVNNKYNNMWWSAECEVATKRRKRAKNILRRNPTVENAQEMRRLENEAKEVIKQTKEKKWKEYINEINSKSPPSEVWNKIKKLKSKYKATTSPLIINNSLITETKEKAKVFAEYFEETLYIPQVAVDDNRERILEKIADMGDSYNAALTREEMDNTLRKIKGSSPGEDYVHNSMLKELPEEAKKLLLELFNKVWDSGNLPEQWKTALIIPIHKHGKPENLTTSYRPIALLPCIGKIMERIVRRRLYWYSETNNLLSSGQSGFRNRCNTIDQIARLEKTIRETFLEKKICLTVLIDLKGAYDSVNHDKLIEKLMDKGIKGKMLQYCVEFLKNRKFKTIYNGEISEMKHCNKGVPQGAAISPLLFNLFISDIPEMDNIICTEYADDIAFSVKANDMRECTRIMQETLDNFYQYTERNKLIINYQKSVAMVFTRKQYNPEPLKINNQELEYVRESKYLGIVLDSPYLNFSKHIQKLKADSLNRLNIMKSIAHNKWGADRAMLQRIYSALILSRLNYGAEIYATASQTNLDSINIIQNTALRIITGTRNSSPVISLEVEANRTPLHMQRMKLIVEYYNKFRNLHRELKVVKELGQDLENQMTRGWSRTTPAPLLVRAKELLIQLQIRELDDAPIPLINIRPPWCHYSEVNTFMHEENLKDLTDHIIYAIFNRKKEIFEQAVEIYTDGSKSSMDNISKTAAAFVIPQYNINFSSKLPDISIMSAELYAITMATEWYLEHTEIHQAVIFTDSLSSIKFLQNSEKNQNIHRYKIHAYLAMLKEENRTLHICWIPSHRGIPGNEKADQAAKEALNNNVITIPNESKADAKFEIQTKLNKFWKEYWHEKVAEQGSGRHLRTIRETVGYLSWSEIPSNRKMETALARMRIGHTGLNAHLFRMGLSPSPLCPCGRLETVNHYLTECDTYSNQRQNLERVINAMEVTFNMRNLLGGSNLDKEKQKIICEAVWRFTTETGRDNEI